MARLTLKSKGRVIATPAGGIYQTVPNPAVPVPCLNSRRLIRWLQTQGNVEAMPAGGITQTMQNQASIGLGKGGPKRGCRGQAGLGKGGLKRKTPPGDDDQTHGQQARKVQIVAAHPIDRLRIMQSNVANRNGVKDNERTDNGPVRKTNPRLEDIASLREQLRKMDAHFNNRLNNNKGDDDDNKENIPPPRPI